MDRLWLVKNKTVLPYEGDMHTYRKEILGLSSKKETNVSLKKQLSLSKNDQRKSNAQKRSSLAPLRKKIVETEALIEHLHKQIAQLDEELISASFHNKIPEKIKERAQKSKKLQEAETLWFTLSDQYETQMIQKQTLITSKFCLLGNSRIIAIHKAKNSRLD
ncbi:putative ABC transporter ATP-binding protein YheS [Bartonella henselae]|uniref:Putative ABC transporter ATP-binding protein YheS n=1 Tax=Bartonella henselae TaxID=38323 RepID=X5MF25_BARHN|nr:putative ABC transporter ATP-binding protein YheS [Bartonella henselae]